MAQTKVKLISDGVIVQGNLHASHGITTAHIGEGSNLYYTDARVGSYLSTNGYATQTDIVAAITDSAPVTLDTLNELAAALGDDPNFATTTATSLGLKAPLASPSFTGNATFAGSVTGQTNSNTFGTASASGRALIVQAGSSNQAIMLKNNLGGDGTISVTGTATTMNYSFGTYSVAPALFIQNDGNVGIGTSSPNSYSNQTTLTINGTSYGRLDLESGGTLRSSLFSQAANTTLAVSTGFFSIDVGSERLRIDTSGNVGIGVTGPDAKLQIKGTGATSGLTFKTTDSSNNETFYIKDGGVVGVRYYPFKIGVPSETANVANTRFQIATTAGDFVVLNDGKTGIGTTDPEQKLHVEGASITVNRGNDDSSIAFQNSTSNATWRIGRDYSNSEALTFAYSATDYPSLTGNGLISINTSGALTVSTAASTIATFKATGSGQNEKQLIIDTGGNRVILDAQTTAGANTNLVFQEGGGNVGIGTTSPSKKLDVAGDFKLDGISGGHFENYAYGTQLNISELTSGGWARANRLVTSDSGGDVFYGVLGTGTTLTYAYWNIGDGSNNVTNYSNGNGIILTRAGNVGIGTTSPSGLTHFYGNGNSTYIVNQKNSTKWSEWHVGGTNHAFIWDSTADMRFMTATSLNGGGASEKMRITSSGQVLVGATNSDVGGSVTGIRFNQEGSILASMDETGDSTFVEYLDRRGTNNEGSAIALAMQGFYKASIGVIGTSANVNDGGITFNTLATNGGFVKTERMRITSGGYVFIGGNNNLGYDSHNIKLSAPSSYALIVRNSDTSTTNSSVMQFNRAETTATTGGYCVIYRQGDAATGTNRWIVFANGNIQNTNNSYGSLSDERKKENIVDATPKLDDLMKVKVRNFNLKGEKTKQIGVVAQELEEVFPGMIDESKIPDSEDETLYKGVKYSVFVPMLIKAVQELKAEVELLKTQINN